MSFYKYFVRILHDIDSYIVYMISLFIDSLTASF